MRRNGDASRLVDGIDGLLDAHPAGNLPVDAVSKYVSPFLGGDLLRGDDDDLPVVLQVLERPEFVVIGYRDDVDAVLYAGIDDLLRL